MKYLFLFERVREMSRLFIPLSNQVEILLSTYRFKYLSAVCATMPIKIPVTTPETSRKGR